MTRAGDELEHGEVGGDVLDVLDRCVRRDRHVWTSSWNLLHVAAKDRTALRHGYLDQRVRAPTPAPCGGESVGLVNMDAADLDLEEDQGVLWTELPVVLTGTYDDATFTISSTG